MLRSCENSWRFACETVYILPGAFARLKFGSLLGTTPNNIWHMRDSGMSRQAKADLIFSELPVELSTFRFHDARHTACSRMIAARIPLPLIGKILGWSAGTLAKMAARYGHFGLEDMRAAMEQIGSRPCADLESPKKSPKSDDATNSSIQ